MEFRLAVGQIDSALDPQERLDWLRSVLADLKADLLLLPELFATGYNVGDALTERAETADGPTAKVISALARQCGIAVYYGFVEAANGVIYNSAQCFGPDGTRLGGHRKLAIPPGFERDVFTPGQGCSVFEYKGIRIGTLICYDAEFGETARHVAGLGADLILVPTALGADWGWVARAMIPTRGFENGVFLAYAISAGVENGLTYLGESFIGAPDGVELARAGPVPEIVMADIDVTRVQAAQARLPYLVDRKALKF